MKLQYLTTTEAVDTAFLFIFAVSGLALLGVTATMIWFLFRYNRKRCPQPLSQKDKNLWLEITWTVIPTILVLGMFWYGWEGYLSLQRIPDDAYQVQATARMWSWNFEYENGRTSDKLVVPVDQPVKVRIESADVLHSFYIPAFRVKRDAVPGMTTWAWFKAEEPGSYDLFCAEYCGVGHSDMITTVEALPQKEFKAWLEKETSGKEGKRAQTLLQDYGCTGCHSLDGSDGIGPTLQGIAGTKRTVVVDGTKKTMVADRDYLRRAIVEPNAEVVEGYDPVMPSFESTIPAEKLETLLDFLSRTEEEREEAKAGEEDGLDGGKLVRDKGCIGCHSTDGSQSAGPTFKGLYGRRTTIVSDGEERTIEADEDYIRRSILKPKADLVKGEQPIMPSFSQLSEEEIDAIIDYLKEL